MRTDASNALERGLHTTTTRKRLRNEWVARQRAVMVHITGASDVLPSFQQQQQLDVPQQCHHCSAIGSRRCRRRRRCQSATMLHRPNHPCAAMTTVAMLRTNYTSHNTHTTNPITKQIQIKKYIKKTNCAPPLCSTTINQNRKRKGSSEYKLLTSIYQYNNNNKDYTFTALVDFEQF